MSQLHVACILFQNLLQVCERIPTIGTQLKILSTVKATMLGAQGTCISHSFLDFLGLPLRLFHFFVPYSCTSTLLNMPYSV